MEPQHLDIKRDGGVDIVHDVANLHSGHRNELTPSNCVLKRTRADQERWDPIEYLKT
jgi:hypothetical protein